MDNLYEDPGRYLLNETPDFIDWRHLTQPIQYESPCDGKLALWTTLPFNHPSCHSQIFLPLNSFSRQATTLSRRAQIITAIVLKYSFTPHSDDPSPSQGLLRGSPASNKSFAESTTQTILVQSVIQTGSMSNTIPDSKLVL